MQDIYVNMRDNYVNMQLIYVNMQDNYVDMQDNVILTISHLIRCVAIALQVRIRMHVYRGYNIEGHIVSITFVFSFNIHLFNFKLQWE